MLLYIYENAPCIWILYFRIPNVTEDELKNLADIAGSPLQYILSSSRSNIPSTSTPFGNVPIGSSLSYQVQHMKYIVLLIRNWKIGTFCQFQKNVQIILISNKIEVIIFFITNTLYCLVLTRFMHILFALYIIKPIKRNLTQCFCM